MQGPGCTRLPLSAVQVDKEDVFICSIAGSGLLKVTDTGAAHSVGVGWVVVEDAARGPVVATQHNEVALVVRGAAEAAVAAGCEAAVLDRAGAEVTVQHPRVHQHNGHMTLGQVCLDVLHTHGAFLHQHLAGLGLCKQLVDPSLLCIKVLPVEGLVLVALVNSQRLGTKAVPHTKVAHQVGQVNGPDAPGQSQLLKGIFELTVVQLTQVTQYHPGAGQATVPVVELLDDGHRQLHKVPAHAAPRPSAGRARLQRANCEARCWLSVPPPGAPEPTAEALSPRLEVQFVPDREYFQVRVSLGPCRPEGGCFWRHWHFGPIMSLFFWSRNYCTGVRVSQPTS